MPAVRSSSRVTFPLGWASCACPSTRGQAALVQLHAGKLRFPSQTGMPLVPTDSFGTERSRVRVVLFLLRRPNSFAFTNSAGRTISLGPRFQALMSWRLLRARQVRAFLVQDGFSSRRLHAFFLSDSGARCDMGRGLHRDARNRADAALRQRRGCDAANGLQDAPWPPVYPKMPGEPPRVAPSRARKKT